MTIFGKERRQLRRSKPMYLVGAPFVSYEASHAIGRAPPDSEARLPPLDWLQGGTGAEQLQSVK